MRGAIPPLPHYAFMAWCPVAAQGQLYLYRKTKDSELNGSKHSLNLIFLNSTLTYYLLLTKILEICDLGNFNYYHKYLSNEFEISKITQSSSVS
jgi:hypothetical protein